MWPPQAAAGRRGTKTSIFLKFWLSPQHSPGLSKQTLSISHTLTKGLEGPPEPATKCSSAKPYAAGEEPCGMARPLSSGDLGQWAQPYLWCPSCGAVPGPWRGRAPLHSSSAAGLSRWL